MLSLGNKWSEPLCQWISSSASLSVREKSGLRVVGTFADVANPLPAQHAWCWWSYYLPCESTQAALDIHRGCHRDLLEDDQCDK